MRQYELHWQTGKAWSGNAPLYCLQHRIGCFNNGLLLSKQRLRAIHEGARLIAISSFRPLADCAPEIARNQEDAFASWCQAFDDIIYFNDPEPKLTAPQVTFVQAENWPRIRELVRFAAQMKDWSAIINADIYVTTDFLTIERELKGIMAKCAVSYRYQFIPMNPTVPKTVVDMGLDIFCGVPEVWQALLKVLPSEFRIGHSQWDSFTLSFMNEHFGNDFYDFTPSEVIYHPKHGNRKSEYIVPAGLPPFSKFAMPKKII